MVEFFQLQAIKISVKIVYTTKKGQSVGPSKREVQRAVVMLGSTESKASKSM